MCLGTSPQEETERVRGVLQREEETLEKMSNQLRKKVKARMALQGMSIILYQIDQKQMAEAMIK